MLGIITIHTKIHPADKMTSRENKNNLMHKTEGSFVQLQYNKYTFLLQGVYWFLKRAHRTCNMPSCCSRWWQSDDFSLTCSHLLWMFCVKHSVEFMACWTHCGQFVFVLNSSTIFEQAARGGKEQQEQTNKWANAAVGAGFLAVGGWKFRPGYWIGVIGAIIGGGKVDWLNFEEWPSSSPIEVSEWLIGCETKA